MSHRIWTPIENGPWIQILWGPYYICVIEYGPHGSKCSPILHSLISHYVSCDPLIDYIKTWLLHNAYMIYSFPSVWYSGIID